MRQERLRPSDFFPIIGMSQYNERVANLKETYEIKRNKMDLLYYNVITSLIGFAGFVKGLELLVK